MGCSWDSIGFRTHISCFYCALIGDLTGFFKGTSCQNFRVDFTLRWKSHGIFVTLRMIEWAFRGQCLQNLGFWRVSWCWGELSIAMMTSDTDAWNDATETWAVSRCLGGIQNGWFMSWKIPWTWMMMDDDWMMTGCQETPWNSPWDFCNFERHFGQFEWSPVANEKRRHNWRFGHLSPTGGLCRFQDVPSLKRNSRKCSCM